MNKIEYLYTVLAEECVEVAQRCTKTNRFGLHEVQPGQMHTNMDRVMWEMADVLAVIEMLEDESAIDSKLMFSRTLVDAKKAKVREYMELSRRNGSLSDESNG